MEEHMLLVLKNELECLDCPEEDTKEVLDNNNNSNGNWKEDVHEDFDDDQVTPENDVEILEEELDVIEGTLNVTDTIINNTPTVIVTDNN